MSFQLGESTRHTQRFHAPGRSQATSAASLGTGPYSIAKFCICIRYIRQASAARGEREFQAAGVEAQLLDAGERLAADSARQGRLLRHQPQVLAVMRGEDQPALV